MPARPVMELITKLMAPVCQAEANSHLCFWEYLGARVEQLLYTHYCNASRPGF